MNGDLQQKLKDREKENRRFREHARHVTNKVKEAGFPKIGAKLHSSLLLLSGPGYGDQVIEEIEGLLETLQG